MCQALGLYELRQYGATCVQAPRCHHTAIPQCVAPTHSKKKNPLREKPFPQSNMSTIHASRGFSVSAKQDAPQHSSKAILTLHSAFTVFLGNSRGFFFLRFVITTVM